MLAHAGVVSMLAIGTAMCPGWRLSRELAPSSQHLQNLSTAVQTPLQIGRATQSTSCPRDISWWRRRSASRSRTARSLARRSHARCSTPEKLQPASRRGTSLRDGATHTIWVGGGRTRNEGGGGPGRRVLRDHHRHPRPPAAPANSSPSRVGGTAHTGSASGTRPVCERAARTLDSRKDGQHLKLIDAVGGEPCRHSKWHRYRQQPAATD